MTLSRDSFDRANGILHGTQTDGDGDLDPLTWNAGFAYDELGHGLGMSSNVIADYGNDISTPYGYHADYVDLQTANVSLSIDVQTAATGSHSGGILLRYADEDNFWYAGLFYDSTVKLYKMASGTDSVIDSVSVGALTGTVGVIASGSTIAVTFNGTTQITTTDSFNSYSTLHGIAMRNDPTSTGNATSLNNWGGEPTSATAVGTGFYVGTITMAVGLADDVSNFSLFPFYNSTYGVLFNGNTNNATQANGLIPRSAMYLYQVIADANSVTGYSVHIFPESLLENWQTYTLASGAYFQDSGFAEPLSDTQIVFNYCDAISGSNPAHYGVRILTRTGSTLSLTAPYDLITQTLAGFQVTNGHYVRYDDTHFARGESITDTGTHRVYGYGVIGSTPSIISTTTAVSGLTRFEYIFGYDAVHGCLMGWDPNANKLYAFPWTPAGGASGAAVQITPSFANFNIITLDKGEVIASGTSFLEAYGFDGAAWTLGDTTNDDGFPFAPGGPGHQWDNTVSSIAQAGQYDDWLSVSAQANRTATGDFHLMYARTAQSGGQFSLSSMGETGFSYDSTGYWGTYGNGLTSFARHSPTLTVVSASVSMNRVFGTPLVQKLIAFATP